MHNASGTQALTLRGLSNPCSVAGVADRETASRYTVISFMHNNSEKVRGASGKYLCCYPKATAKGRNHSYVGCGADVCLHTFQEKWRKENLTDKKYNTTQRYTGCGNKGHKWGGILSLLSESVQLDVVVTAHSDWVHSTIFFIMCFTLSRPRHPHAASRLTVRFRIKVAVKTKPLVHRTASPAPLTKRIITTIFTIGQVFARFNQTFCRSRWAQ